MEFNLFICSKNSSFWKKSMDKERVDITVIRTPARKEGWSGGIWSWNTDVSILTFLISRQSSRYFGIWSQKFDFLIYEIIKYLMRSVCFPGGSEVKASACNAGDLGSIPGLGRSPREGNGTSLQYSCLENSMDRGVRWATMKSQRVGHDWALTLSFIFQVKLRGWEIHYMAKVGTRMLL